MCLFAVGQSALAQTLPPLVEQCRVAAGFGADLRFEKPANPQAVELCNAAVAAHPQVTLASAFLGRALYLNDREKEAFSPIERSANAGDAVGMVLLGVAYEHGYGTRRSVGEALVWYEKAAELGHVNGQYNAAVVHLRGGPLQANVPQARKWLAKAAAQGMPSAWNMQAWMWMRGMGTAADPAQALVLYHRAAEAGDADAQYNLAVLQLEAQTPAALDLLRRAAAQDHAGAMALLGELHWRGRLLPRDDAQAIQLLQAAAKREDTRAAWILAVMAQQGRLPGKTRWQIDEATMKAASDQSAELAQQLKDDSPWDSGLEPTDWQTAQRLLARIGDGGNLLRIQAVAALNAHALFGRIGPAATREILSDAISEGQSAAVRQGARQVAQALGLNELVATVPNAADQERAAQALASAKTTAKPVLPAAKPALARVLSPVQEFRQRWASAKPDNQVQALTVLDDMSDADAAPLIELAGTSKNIEVRRALMRVLAQRRLPQFAGLIHRALADGDGELRRRAVFAARDNRLPLSAAQLRALVNDPLPQVQREVLEASAKTGWSIPDLEMLARLHASDSEMRKAALRAARRQPTTAVRNALLAMLDGPDDGDAWSALESIRLGQEAMVLVRALSAAQLDQGGSGSQIIAIATTDPASISAELQTMLASPDPLQKRRALWALRAMQAPLLLAQIEALAAQDADAQVRKDAVRALSRIAAPRSMTVMLQAIKDADVQVRLAAFYGLRRGSQAEHDAALALAKDPDAQVRARVGDALLDVDSDPARQVVLRLQGDPDVNVRRSVARRGSGIPDAEKTRVMALPLKDRPFALGRLASFDPAWVFAQLLAMAVDDSLGEDLRFSALYQAKNHAALGMRTDHVATLQALAMDPSAVRSIRKGVLDVLEASRQPEAARATVQIIMSERQLGDCQSIVPGPQRLASFAPSVAGDVIRPYLQHPNPLVQAFAAACMAKQGQRDVAQIALSMLGNGAGQVPAAAVDVLTRLRSADAATTLAQLLRASQNERDQDLLREALWATQSQIAYDDALAWQGSLRYVAGAWADALAAKPSAAGLQRLMAALPRVDGERENVALAAVQVSSAMPDAPLDLAMIERLVDVLRFSVTDWELHQPQKTFSPLAFLTVCMGTEDRPDSTRRLGVYVYTEPIRVLPDQRAALLRSVDQCNDYWSKRGRAPSAAVQAWSIRMLLNAGLVDQALQVTAATDASPFASAAFMVARAEALMQAKRLPEAVALLDTMDSDVLPRFGERDHADSIRNRSLMLRGLMAQRQGDDASAQRLLMAAADRDGRGATGIVALGFALRYPLVDAANRARWVLEGYNEEPSSGPLVREAMEELLAFLVQHEAQQGRPQQSLIDADRLLVLAASDEKPQALNLGDDEKSRAILQLRELEARVQRLAGKDGRGSERGSQPDAVNPELALARQELKAWLTQMRSQYPAATSLLKPEPLDLARLQQALGPDRALIQYVLLPRQSFAWVVTRESAVVVPIAQGEAQLRAWVGAARSQYTPGIALRSATVSGQRTDRAKASAQGNPQEAMQQLSRALVEPVRAAADGKSHWIIVPHGSLHALAFAALPSPGDGSPLVLRKTLSVIASAATFAGTPDSAAKPSRKLLALGNPTSPDPQWSRLPSAEIEARRIAQINGAADSTVLIGAAATRTSLLGQALARTALHLALHGEARSGDASRLVFADGYLSVKDIWSLALDGSPRVVLSACETGLGESLTGNEVLSIGNGFLFAGAQSVVSSLWRVPDEDTRALMEAFYTELAAGKTTAQAMSAAQRQAIVQGRSARAWAAFVVNGL